VAVRPSVASTHVESVGPGHRCLASNRPRAHRDRFVKSICTTGDGDGLSILKRPGRPRL
jgi:hypothetical protein